MSCRFALCPVGQHLDKLTALQIRQREMLVLFHHRDPRLQRNKQESLPAYLVKRSPARWRRRRRGARAQPAFAGGVRRAGSSPPPSARRAGASSPMLPVPTTNMQSISAQQQPTQKTPWSTPMAERLARRVAPVPARCHEGERRVALLEAAILECAELEQPGHREHRRAERPSHASQPRMCAPPAMQRRPRGARGGRTRTRRQRSRATTSATSWPASGARA